ncbi:MAG: hypothetical protein JO306_16760 [Gemmatimonadetes bacterium]|nr:hypothetical protein [Gemmatimonadota bacterium]
MEKRSLDLATLRVESFAADAPSAGTAGTVHAHEFTIGLNCPETNYRTCPHTCAAGC